jgi:hypothetical protein
LPPLRARSQASQLPRPPARIKSHAASATPASTHLTLARSCRRRRSKLAPGCDQTIGCAAVADPTDAICLTPPRCPVLLPLRGRNRSRARWNATPAHPRLRQKHVPGEVQAVDSGRRPWELACLRSTAKQ